MSKEPKRNVYVGHRYVPKIMGEWDKQETYEGLSIVTYQGTSYTSKKRVPVGIDILNEEYWVVTGNYNAQVENYRQEVRDMGDYVDSEVNDLTNYVNSEVKSKANQVDLDETNQQLTQTENDLEQRGINVNKYENINTAIQEIANNGGGKLILPAQDIEYDEDIHILENVEIEGITGARLIQTNPNARIIRYSKDKLKNLTIVIMENCNQEAILFHNKYLRRNSTEESRPEGVKSVTDDIQFETVFNPNTPNKRVFGLYATHSVDAEAHGAGFAQVQVFNCTADGFNVGINIDTDRTGWVNGCYFDLRLTNFTHAVVANKSDESLGVDYNVFNLYLQTTPHTRDIFIDNTGINNNYDGCTIWDMETNTQARTGNVILTGVKNGTSIPKERYHMYLRSKRYHLIGRFDALTSYVHHVMLSVTSYENYRVDYFVRGGNTPVVERRNIGDSTRLHNSFTFHIKRLENGQVELYIHNPSENEIEAVFYIESFRSFNPSPFTIYTTITGLEELNVLDYYPSDQSQDRIFFSHENNFTGTTPRISFKFGITYSNITSSVPEEERGTPDNKLGLLITHRIASAGTSYNFQEFHVFGSSDYTIYRRYGNDTEFGWGEWSAPITP